ncbi:acyl carrier protein [Gilvimarinus polysaccharolyticus]|uniref:acyl carrier protein n=1 Tax=Gilvimarinus polysaccharolyticus TaxID=863921 RepID=UPI0006732892|nr:acyl carrier protein [Gilvimarinus polysaccharolyticus]
MTKDEIYSELKNVLVKSFMVDESAISLDAGLYTDLDFDSIDAIDLAAKIHSVTGKQLKPEQFKEVRTIGDAVNVVDELMRNG